MASPTDGHVHFVCVASEHATLGRDPRGGALTLHQGEWAFCPFAETEGHAWDSIAHVAISALRSRLWRDGGAKPAAGSPASV